MPPSLGSAVGADLPKALVWSGLGRDTSKGLSDGGIQIMGSNRKAEANRKNAQKSTGPRSAAGKKASSLNATKHGLTAASSAVLTGESESDLRALWTGFHETWSPAGDAEAFLVEQLVHCAWRMKRAQRVETELFSRQILADEARRLEVALAPKFQLPAAAASEFSSGLEPSDAADSEKRLAEARLSMAGLRLGTGFAGLSSAEDLLGKLQRYETAAERAYYKAAHELERLQRRRAGEDVGAPAVADVNISLVDPAAPVSVRPVPVPAGKRKKPKKGGPRPAANPARPVLSGEGEIAEVPAKTVGMDILA
jgi:hypothetical protein